MQTISWGLIFLSQAPNNRFAILRDFFHQLFSTPLFFLLFYGKVILLFFFSRLMFAEDPKKTTETIQIYLKKAQGIIKKACTDLKIDTPSELDPRQLVAWMELQRPQIYKKTWRLYKSAIVCYLEQSQDFSEETLSALDHLKLLSGEDCLQTTDRTSSSKLKKFPWKDFQKITDFLRTHQGKWHLPLLDWIISGSLTGLRPKEWLNSQLVQIDGSYALIIQNAKHTNGRAFGPQRTLLLDALASEEIDTIQRHVQRVYKWQQMNQYEDLYQGCALTLNYVSRKLWPRREKHITLYSCRHQFTANAKASGFSTTEIAAMMGHAVDTTATLHYGKKTAGHELLRVRAHQNDIEQVKQKFLSRDDSLSKKQAPREPEPKNTNLSVS